MSDHPFIRALNHLRPRHGWLVFILLAGTLALLVGSVLDVGWVADDRVVIPATLLGFLTAALLAQWTTRPGIALAILLIAGVALAFFLAADLGPPWRTLSGGSGEILEFWRLRSALFADRAAGWLTAFRGGERSTEIIVFTLGLALAAWLVAAALAWSAYRARKPYVGLTLVGLALAANTFYGRADLYWAVFFFGLAVTAGTYLHYLYREDDWDRRGIDYSAEVRTDLILYTAGLSLGIMSLAMALPAINFRAIADRFQRQDAVVAAEETVSRAFAGVAQPRNDEGAVSGGGLPRSFLLGGRPELENTVVMTATLRTPDGVALSDLAGYHWRSVSFDVYTGRGWRRSPEREENVNTGQAIPTVAEPAGAVAVAQEIDWIYDQRATRYTLGRPLTFSHDLVAQWRGQADLVGVRGRNSAPMRYTAETRPVIATADELRAARLEDTPAEIRARYTALPDTVPARVRDLADEIVAGTGDSPYDQARALEQFLRQYPYSLDLPPTPDGDIVDYFLFDLQTGFCDYYASAMVVMARSLGLPARLGVGFLQRPPDSAGVQTIRQIDAHSWAEVYFAGYGWIEFEPTAPFATAETAAPATGETTPPTLTPFTDAPPAVPERAPQRNTPWPWLIGLAALTLVAWRLWGRRLRERFSAKELDLDDTQLAFARLQESAAALGRGGRPSQTPAEFGVDLLDAPALETPEGQAIRPAIQRLIDLFAARQYGRATVGPEARAAWEGLRGPLRRMIWRRRLHG